MSASTVIPEKIDPRGGVGVGWGGVGSWRNLFGEKSFLHSLGRRGSREAHVPSGARVHMPSPYASNPQYMRAVKIFSADSFTPYALSVSHLCNGEWPGISAWTITKLGYKNATITAVDSESKVTTFTLTLDALLKAYDLAPENAPPPPTTSPPSPPQAGGTRHASALRTLVLVTDDQSSPYDVDPLVATRMPIAPLRTLYDYDVSQLLKLIKPDAAPVTKDHLRACFNFVLKFVSADQDKPPKHELSLRTVDWVGSIEVPDRAKKGSSGTFRPAGSTEAIKKLLMSDQALVIVVRACMKLSAKEKPRPMALLDDIEIDEPPKRRPLRVHAHSS